MTVDLSELMSLSGKTDTVRAEFSADTCFYGGQEYPISEKTPFTLTFRNTETQELSIEGATSLSATQDCARCLKPVATKYELSFMRRIPLEDGDVRQSDGDDEQACISEKVLDVDELILEELFLNWRTKVLCKEDCKGLCPVCGADLNEGECGCDRAVMDPRMAQFQDIFENLKAD